MVSQAHMVDIGDYVNEFFSLMLKITNIIEEFLFNFMETYKDG